VKNILLIGDQIIDKYIVGSCDRISPEAPVPIVDVEKIKFVAGGASNVEQNLKALGANVDAWYGDKKPSIKTRIVSACRELPCSIRGRTDCISMSTGLEYLRSCGR